MHPERQKTNYSVLKTAKKLKFRQKNRKILQVNPNFKEHLENLESLNVQFTVFFPNNFKSKHTAKITAKT